MSEKAPQPRLAATVLLLRQREEMEVFMVVRHKDIEFASGMLVFPGGSVDASDSDDGVRALCGDTTGIDDDQLTLQVAAIREAFEECGVLLARDETGELVNQERLRDLEHYRKPLDKNELSIKDFLEREKLTLACDRLQAYAHWVTPEGAPKRFDTYFYLAVAPDDQIALHDGYESVDSTWINPGRAVEQAAEGKWNLMFPTRLNLTKLSLSSSADKALEAAKRQTIVTVRPKLHKTETGAVLRIPAEAGYGVTEEVVKGR